MAGTNSNVFLVQFSVITENSEKRRVYFLNRFVNEGLGEHIKILESVIFPHNPLFSCMMILQSDSIEHIKSKLLQCAESFTTKIEPVQEYTVIDPNVEANFCLLTDAVTKPTFVPIRNPKIANQVKPKAILKVGKTGSFTNIVLLQSAGALAVKAYAHETFPEAFPMVNVTMSISNFISKIKNTSSHNKQDNLEAEESNIAINASTSCTIVNVGKQVIFYNSGDSMFNIYNNVKKILPNATAQITSETYVWQSLFGEYKLENRWSVQGIPSHEINKTPTSNAIPKMIIPCIPGETIHVDVAKNEFDIITEASRWLHGLFYTNHYDPSWPEDSYVGEKELAYQFILSKLPGKIHPHKSKIPSGLIIAINYLENPNFSEANFLIVKSHLIDELTYFEVAFKWYGLNGIIDTINSNLTLVSNENLQKISKAMSVSSKTNIVSTLNTILNIFSNVIGIIPGAGPILNGIFKSAWSGANFGISTNQRIEATVGELAGKLADFLLAVDKMSAVHYDLITSNYGRLKAFTYGVSEEIISTDQLGVTLSNGSKPTVSQSYIEAGANAWEIIFYKALFAVNHTPLSTFTLSSVLPSNPYNPNQGNFNYNFAFNCVYFDSSNNKNNAYLIIEAMTGAPESICKDLFGSNSKLNVNPMAFFVGFNGWTATIPVDFNISIVSIGAIKQS